MGMMLKPPPKVDCLEGYALDKLVLSHSTQSLLRGCARKFEFRKMFGDVRDREEEFAAAVGHAMHRGYQEYLVSRSVIMAVWALGLNYPHPLFEQAKNANERSMEACYSTLMAMIGSQQLADYEVIHIRGRDGIERPAVEVPFALHITGAPFPMPVWFVGFVDCILYNKVTMQYIVVDIKSSRRYIKDYSARYEYDAQCLPYGIILEHLLGQPVKSFEVGYLSVYIDLMEPKIALYRFNKTPELISDWHRTLCDDIDRITRYYNAQWVPRATSGEACIGFGRECFYREFCHTRDPQIVSRLIQGEIQEKLFSTGAEPWVVADLAYEQFDRRAA